MSNQLHGKKIEDIIKSLYPGSSDNYRAYTSIWDIEAKYDNFNNLPTSIKACKYTSNMNVGLASAVKFWDISEPFRLLICSYKQDGFIKNFNKIYEFIIPLNVLLKLKGDITNVDIKNFENMIKSFNISDYIENRKQSKLYKKIYCLLPLKN